MKTTQKITSTKPLDTVHMKILGGKTIDIRFSDPADAKNTYDLLKNQMVFNGQAIKQIEFL